MPDQYSGFFAEFYDILHASYVGDVEAYIEHARRFGPKLLELGSGTGRVLVPLARAGFPVTGVDLSDDMMAICRQKLAAEPPEVRARVRMVKGNILDLDLDLADTFDLVIAPCNLVNCFTGPGEALALMRFARRHLGDGGVFILDNSVPDVPRMVQANGVTERCEFTHPVTGTTITDTFTAHYDFTLQLEIDHIGLVERDDHGILRREEATSVQAFYFPRELRVMLRLAGLEPFHEQGSIRKDIPIDAGAGEMVFFCRKA